MYNQARIKLKKFDLNDMVDHATIALIAKRGSGKSVLVKDIMKTRKHIPATVIICKTEKLNSSYDKLIPNSYIYYEFENEILNRIFVRQKMLIEDNKKREKEGKKLKDDRVLLIMDDCMSDKNWVKDPTIGELFFNGRHYHISFILTLQYSKGLPPDMRSNLDYIFLFADDVIKNRQRLYDDYAGMFPSFDVFQQVFLDVTEDYGCMVINNRKHTKHIEEKVFWYRARDSKDKRLGCNRYKIYHNKYFNKKWDKLPPSFDYSKYGSKRRVNVVVEKTK